jgi:hypothetical protein
MNDAPNASEDLTALGRRLHAWQPETPADRFAGRGIVVCAGGARVFTNAWVLISILRRTLGCTLPIEVWHFGPDELSASMAALLAELDATPVDALPVIAREGVPIRDGWQLKSFALQHSRFAEVLLLDADQVPVRDPAEIFDWPQYREAGALFWPDMIELRESNPVWAALGLAPRRTVSFESGQLAVDKRRHWRALSIVGALNAEADRLYRMIYGDKDTFLIGWQLAGADFALVPHTPFIDERMLVQRDFAGAPLFQHRTNAKWSYAGAQHEVEGFVYFDEATAALAELKARWNGRVVHIPDPPAAARAAQPELLAAGPLLLEVTDDETIHHELLPRGELAHKAGRANDRQNWWCEATPDGIDFVIADADRVTYRLHRLDRDHWEGVRFRVPEHAVTLRPASPAEPATPPPGLVDDLIRAARSEAELRTALALLCRVDPGALARLRHLAAQSPELAAFLPELPLEHQRHEPQRGMILGQFYHFTGKDD